MHAPSLTKKAAYWLMPIGLSLMALLIGDNWSPAPTWTVKDPAIMQRWPQGVTEEDELVTIEKTRENVFSLAVYDVETGRELRRHPLPWQVGFAGLILNHGKQVVLSAQGENARDFPVMVRLDNGAITSPPDNIKFFPGSIGKICATMDGRFAGPLGRRYACDRNDEL